MIRRWSLPVLSLLLACASAPAVTAPDQASAPRPQVPASSPPVVEGNVTTLRAAGIPVIVRHVPGAENVTTTLFIRGGTQGEPDGQSGVESVALSLVTVALQQDVAQRWNVGADFQFEVAEDLSLVSGRGPLARWVPMCDRILQMFVNTPVVDQYVDRAREVQRLRLDDGAVDSSEHVARALRRAFFKGHRDERPPGGTVQSVSGLTAPAIAEHLARLRQRGRLLVVVVGDVDAREVATLVERRLAGVADGGFPKATAPAPSFARPTGTLVPSGGSMGMVVSLFPAPNWSDPSFAAALVAAEAIEAALTQDLYVRRGLSYYLLSQVTTDWRWPMGKLAVASADLPAAFQAMQAAIARLQAAPLSELELRGLQQTTLTRFHLHRASTDTIARTLGYAHIRAGDWRWSLVGQRIRAVTPAQLQGFARTGLVNLQTVVLADPARVDLRRFQ